MYLSVVSLINEIISSLMGENTHHEDSSQESHGNAQEGLKGLAKRKKEKKNIYISRASGFLFTLFFIQKHHMCAFL
jgi:hypothetical protein